MTKIFAIIKFWQFDTTNLKVAVMKKKNIPLLKIVFFLPFLLSVKTKNNN